MSNTTLIIGERIRNYRLQLNLSQEQLAEMADCHRTYIGQVERGEKNATIESIEKIAIALTIPLSQLFDKLGGEGNWTINYPLLCYDLIASKDLEEQERLYQFLINISGLSI